MAADTPHQTYLRSRYFEALDGLRGLSVLALIWHHSAPHSGFAAQGYLGVSFFFAISGLLITTLLLREQGRTGTISLSGFYLRRTLRIFPLYYAVVALYVVLVTVLQRGTPAADAFFANLPSYLTYTSNWFVDLSAGNRVIFYFAWSLATEEQFYLLWPSVVRYARTWYLPPLVMLGLFLLGELARWAVESGLTSGAPLPMRMATTIAGPICLGCLAAYLLHRPAGFRVAWALAGHRWSALLAAALLVAALARPTTPTAVTGLAMTFLVVACCIRPDHALRGALGNRLLRHVGTVSYGIYLLHMLALNATHRLLPNAGGFVVFVAASLLAVLLASISHRWFEQPIMALKDRLAPASRPSPAPDTVPVRGA
jgi:peptidoglycan/LPS O-acetylase OafA/YrhL